MLWTMRTPYDEVPAKEEADPKRFGHAKRAINVIDVRQSYPQQVVDESLRRLGCIEKAGHFIKHSQQNVETFTAPTTCLVCETSKRSQSFYTTVLTRNIIKARLLT